MEREYTMSNPANSGTLIGRVAKGGVKAFTNSDGSRKLVFNLAVDENFTRSGKSGVDTDFIPVSTFIPAKAQGLGSWERVHEGDLIAINIRISCKNYVGKDGETVFPPATIEVDGYPQYLEPKSVVDARAARKAQETSAPVETAPAGETPEVAPQEDVQAEIERLTALVASKQATTPNAFQN